MIRENRDGSSKASGRRRQYRLCNENLNQKAGKYSDNIEEALRESEERYRTLFDRSPDAIFLIDPSEEEPFSRIIDCNDTACQMNGYSRDELIGKCIDVLHIKPTTQKERKQIHNELRLHGRKIVQSMHRRKDGTIFPVESSIHIIPFNGREVIMGIDRDITERYLAEAARLESEEKYRTLFEGTPDGIALIEIKDDFRLWPIVDCNKAFCAMNGYTFEELIGKDIDIVNSVPADYDGRKRYLEKLHQEKIYRTEITHTRRDGTHYVIENIGILVVIRDREFILGIDRDITERKKAEETIRYQALYDQLTGLPNRTLFSDRINSALSHVRRSGGVLAVIFIDLDRFKLINETLGHDIGDKLLQSVADRLANSIREGDTVARFGGDEFIILLPEVQRMEDVALSAENILKNFKEPFVLRDMELYITVSIGIAVYPHDGDDADKLLINADAAQSRAKEQGRNNYQYYTSTMNAKASERLVMESSLRRALDREEFVLFYQPQIAADSGEIVGAEALIRWNHPELGFISPGEFIPLAEEMGLIGAVGEWVLRKACLENIKWRAEGYKPIRMAVNLSPIQFMDRGLIKRVEEILHETGHNPNDLELEVTETMAMKNADYATQVLGDFKSMGVRISLDDFGTGYSSLAYLKKLPLDTLKIDRSFVLELMTDTNDKTIAKTIILLSHSLGLHVVAEGVETAEQADFLKENGCDLLQGFYYSRPVPPNQFTNLMKARS